MVAVGGGTPEFHLIMGKAFLNRYEVGEAKAELERAGEGNPNLPYLHLNLGIAYMRLGENDRAEAEFRRDMALEPDLADNYEQLGVLYSRMQRDEDAEKSFRAALNRNAKSAGAYLGLAKLCQKQNKPERGLKMIDTALRLSADIHGGHFVRGRILMQLGRQKEARSEFAAAQKNMEGQLNKERQSQEDDRVPNPELTQRAVLARGRAPARWPLRRPRPVRLQTAGRRLGHQWAVLPLKRRPGPRRRASRSSSAIGKTAWCRGTPRRGGNFPARDETRDWWKRGRAEPAFPAFGAEFRRGEDPDPRRLS